MHGHQGGRWENLGALARKLSTSPRALSVLTGPLWVAPTKDAGRFDRIDIGLNLKSGNKGLCVADYTRPMKEGNGWEFSQQCVKLLQDYKRAHPWVFAALQSDPDGGFEGLQLDVALKHLPEPSRPEQGWSSRAAAHPDRVLVLLHPIPFGHIRQVADQGNILPPKSTWVEPKIRSALFIHEFQSA